MPEEAIRRSTRRAAADPAPDRRRQAAARLRLVGPDVVTARDALATARTTTAMLLLPAAMLTVIGVVMVLSASSVEAYAELGSSFFFFNRQVVYAAIGAGALVIASRLPTSAWRRLSLPLLVTSVGLMLVALTPSAGTSAYGASRWIEAGPITIQPSELAKLATVTFAATILARKWKHLGEPAHLALPLGPAVALVAGIVILQRDLGTTIVICGTAFSILFCAGVRKRYLLVVGLSGLAMTASLIFGEAYRRTRFLNAFDPWRDPKGSGYQLIQGYIALGSGGWTGVGLGASRQKWQYVPNAHTDFIFAILGEELGLIGALVVLALFALLIFGAIRVAIHAPDNFGRLLAAGIASWLGLQTVVNLGAVTGLLPITGVPLPFVSFGGSALVVSLVAVGVLVGIARRSAGSRPRARAPSRRSE